MKLITFTILLLFLAGCHAYTPIVYKGERFKSNFDTKTRIYDKDNNFVGYTLERKY